MTKIGIIGCGGIAAIHAQALDKIPNASLTAAADCDIVRAKAFATKWHIDGNAVFANADEMLDCQRLDAVLVATPPCRHLDDVLSAARHKVNVLVEKPLAVSTDEIDRMAEACRKAGIRLGCILQTRWSDEFRKLRDMLARRELGRVTFASVEVPWWRDESYFTACAGRGRRSEYGGGALMIQAIHAIDWLVALMPPIAEVKGFSATLAHKVEVEDTAVGAIRFADGALGSLYATTAAYPGRGRRISFFGTRGSVSSTDDRHAVTGPLQVDPELHRQCIAQFLDAIEGGEDYPIGPEEARKSLALIEALCPRPISE